MNEDLYIKITRNKFEELCMDLFKKCFPPLEMLLKDAKISKSQINEIILLGGSSRIPKIQEMIKEFFNGKELNKSLNPDEAKVCGASIGAAIMTNIKNEKMKN